MGRIQRRAPARTGPCLLYTSVGSVHTLHIVGGGGQNQLLNQLTADATGKRVVVGPFEASAAGNVLVQARACRTIPDDAKTPDLLGHHVVETDLQPNADSQATWQQAALRYAAIAAAT